MFKFPLGAVIEDKDINSHATVVGRVLDVDDSNHPLYLLCFRGSGRVEWQRAKVAERNYTLESR